jgi:predicted metal-binding membrane protein
VGAGVAAAAVREPSVARALPTATGIVVLLAGAFQFTVWKARHLAGLRAAYVTTAGIPGPAAARLRDGARLGIRCVRSCAAPTAVLLALGAMDLRVMAVVTLAITAERLAPRGMVAARVGRAVAVFAGLILITSA